MAVFLASRAGIWNQISAELQRGTLTPSVTSPW